MADATTATTPKIEELRVRLKADPKSRLFYPLAEELRKIQQFEESEQILRDGIQSHPAYLSAWISLGRVLRERSRDHEAVEVLKRALVLDPGNVVAAKLLAQAYLGVGDKLEAIKKFKLVFAMMPSDEEVEQAIQVLDRELNPDNYPQEAPAAELSAPPPDEVAEEAPLDLEEEVAPVAAAQPFSLIDEPSRFDSTDPVPFGVEEEPFGSTADSALSSLLEPQEPLPAEALTSEEPLSVGGGAVLEAMPAEAPIDEEAEPFGDVAAAPAGSGAVDEDVESRFDGTQPYFEPPSPPAEIPATMTMAQLYESQGHEQQAKEIYRHILEQQPAHEEARVALSRAELPARGMKNVPVDRYEKIRRLEQWRARVART